MEIQDFEDLMKLDGTNLDELGLGHLVEEVKAVPVEEVKRVIKTEIARPHWTISSVQNDFPEQDFGEDMFDPTGFVPLEVMIEQQRLAGRKALIQRSMFDFDDWKDIYLDSEPPDDFDDDFAALEYIRKVEEKKQKLFEERQKELNASFAEFLASKRKNNATTTINDDDVINSSKEDSAIPPVSDTPSTED